MSALPPIADIGIAIPYQPLTNVCFAPESGRKWATEFMSAYDPCRTFAAPANQLAPLLGPQSAAKQ